MHREMVKGFHHLTKKKILCRIEKATLERNTEADDQHKDQLQAAICSSKISVNIGTVQAVSRSWQKADKEWISDQKITI